MLRSPGRQTYLWFRSWGRPLCEKLHLREQRTAASGQLFLVIAFMLAIGNPRERPLSVFEYDKILLELNYAQLLCRKCVKK